MGWCCRSWALQKTKPALQICFPAPRWGASAVENLWLLHGLLPSCLSGLIHAAVWWQAMYSSRMLSQKIHICVGVRDGLAGLRGTWAFWSQGWRDLQSTRVQSEVWLTFPSLLSKTEAAWVALVITGIKVSVLSDPVSPGGVTQQGGVRAATIGQHPCVDAVSVA